MLAPDFTVTAAEDITSSSATFSLTLAEDRRYLYSATCATWIQQGATPTASVKGAGCVLVPAGETMLIFGVVGAGLAAIGDTGSTGRASLARVMTY